MATVTVLKKTPSQVIASFVGTGAGTLNLADMAMPYEILDAGNAQVNINIVNFSVSGTTTVKRGGAGGTTVLVLTEGQDTMRLAPELGCSISTANGGNLYVDKAAADGTVIISLSKVAGFTPNVETSIGFDITQKTSIRA
jgi:hypothetical protein